MSSMKRIKTDLVAIGIAVAALMLFAERAEPQNIRDSKLLSQAQARAESAVYLEGPPADARLHRAATRWAVTDGHTTAWLDARTGELVELSFTAPRQR